MGNGRDRDGDKSGAMCELCGRKQWMVTSDTGEDITKESSQG